MIGENAPQALDLVRLHSGDALPPEFFYGGGSGVPAVTEATVAQQCWLLELLRSVHAEGRDTDDIRQILVEQLFGFLDATAAWITEWNPGAEAFEFTCFRGVSSEVNPPRTATPDGYGAEAVRRMRTLIVSRCEFDGETARGRFLRSQRIGSALCAPMSVSQVPFGIICVGRERERPFEWTESILLGAAAAQGAIAIRNGLQIEQERVRAEHLRRLVSINHELRKSTLSGGENEGLAEVLAAAIDRPVRIVDSLTEETTAWCPPSGAPSLEASASLSVPVVLDHDEGGAIEIAGNEDFDDLDRLLIAQATNALAMELSSKRTAQESEWKLQGELLEELAAAPNPLPDSLVRRARHLEVEISDLGRIIAVSRERASFGATPLLLAARRAVSAQAIDSQQRVLAFERGPIVIASLPKDTPVSAVHQIRKSLEGQGRIAIGVGISGNVAEATREAEACLNLARQGGNVGVVHAEDLGVLRGVIGDGRHDLAVEFVREVLAPVVTADDDARIPLLETLSAFIAADGHRKKAAELCFVHLSTMRYRLKQLQEVFPIDDQQRLLEAHTALAVLRILRAGGHDPFRDRGTGPPAES
jgi:sugar diacid utilization regulator